MNALFFLLSLPSFMLLSTMVSAILLVNALVFFLDCVPELAVWYDDAVLLGKEAHQTMQLFGVSAEFL